MEAQHSPKAPAIRFQMESGNGNWVELFEEFHLPKFFLRVAVPGIGNLGKR
jgi:hypothetical protein